MRLIRRLPTSPRRLSALAFAVCLSGCGRNDIQVYRVAKETGTDQAQPPASKETAAPSSAGPSLQWKLPPGWKEVPPGQMRVASFAVEGSGGAKADVSIVPLPGMAGNDLENVNRWRGQVGQAPLTAEDVAKAAEPVEIAGQTGKLFDQGGTQPESGAKARVLAAILRRDGVAWFFKMTGDDALVSAQKPAFISFLKSIQFPSSLAASQTPPDHPSLSDSGPPPADAAASQSAKPTWQVPATWQEAPAMPPLVAKYQIAGDGGAQAGVNISVSSSDSGGSPLANVNRWRSQLGLEPVGEADMKKLARPLDLDAAKGSAMLVDMSGTDVRTQQKARSLAVIVSLPGQTWFYKLMGNEQLVERESAAFTKLVQTAKYPDAQ